METGTEFDLKAALKRWRSQFTKDFGFWPNELDELESGLRDRYDEFLAAGITPKQAFRAAEQIVGTPAELDAIFTSNRYADSLRGRATRISRVVFPPLVLNYFRTASRTMQRAGMLTFISASGLAVALACCIWVLIYLGDELGYDEFHDHSTDIVRLTIGNTAETPELWAPALSDQIPGIVRTVRIKNEAFGQTMFKYDETVLSERNGIFADATIFEVFSWDLSAVNPDTALDRPFAMVVSPEFIERYHLPDNPIGSIIEVSGITNTPRRRPYEITGVLRRADGRSHISFDFILSMETILHLEEQGEWGTPFNWTNRVLKTYLLLAPAVDREQVAQKISSTLRTYIPDERYSLDNVELQELTRIHLESDKRSEFPGGGKLTYVYLLGALAMIVLLLAMVNFVNLATSRSLQRSKEVGMRKAIGASSSQIRWQYMTEAILVTFVSLLGAFALAWWMQDFVRDMTLKDLSLKAVLNPGFAISIVLITLATGAASGFYPAMVLSRYEAVEALKPGWSSGTHMSLLRKGLVVFQFVMSIGMIAITLVMTAQMKYVRERPLGYDPENIFVVEFGHSTQFYDSLELVVSQLRGDARIDGVSTSHSLPTSFLNSFAYYPEGSGPDESVGMGNLALDAYLLDLLDVEVIAGRTFIPDVASDSVAFILNESATRAMGWEPNSSVLGRVVDWPLGDLGFAAPVVGLVKDFHYNSLRQEIEPIVFNLSRFGSSNLLVKVRPENAPSVIADLEAIWKSIEPDYPFAYSWMSDRLQTQYEDERRLTRLFTFTAGLALIIACLGLFSLASFSIRQRIKEIGIRKTMGASTQRIVFSFAAEFVILLIVSLTVAVPIATFAVMRWLDSFAYRTEIGIMPFVQAAFIAFAIAMISVTSQAVRAARVNPAITLRSQ